MSTEVTVALIVLAGGGLTVLGNYLINKRSTSGTIKTSEAVDLWAEANALRKEYKDRAETLETRLEEVNNKLQSVMDELGKLRIGSATMIEKIAELKGIIKELQNENKRLLALKKEDV